MADDVPLFETAYRKRMREQAKRWAEANEPPIPLNRTGKYRKVELVGVTSKREEPRRSRKAIVIANESTSLDGVAKDSGTLKGSFAKAKERSPFAVAHAPAQATFEHKDSFRDGNTVRQRGKGGFQGKKAYDY